jgi:hypothetical protein
MKSIFTTMPKGSNYQYYRQNIVENWLEGEIDSADLDWLIQTYTHVCKNAHKER